MFIRRVSKLSTSLKNLSFSTQNVSAYHLSHVGKLKGTADMPESTEDNNNKLMPNLRSSSLSKILITLQSNERELQGSHIVTAMSSVYHLTRREISEMISNQTTEPENLEWKEHLFFKEMSEILKLNINKLSGSETVQILYYTKKLKDTFELDRVLIDHLEKNIKNLSFDDFRIISSLFKKSKKSKLLSNLQNNMLKNFISRVSMDYQKDNIDFLANGLYFLSCNSTLASAKLLNIFVQDILNYKNDIPLDKALIIHDSLCYLNYEHFSIKALKLLREMEKIIISNIDEVELSSINYILFAISQKIKSSSSNRDELYNAEFIEKLTRRLVTADAGFENALSALICLNKMRHCNMEILNYVCASHFEKITLKKERIAHHNGKLLVILSGLAQANYKSMFWDEIQYYVMNEESLLNYDHKTLCILCLNAVCLDCYPIGILKKLYDGTYDFSKDAFLHWTFCKIYQKIKTNSSYNGPLPTESQLVHMNKMFRNSLGDRRRFPLLNYLEEAMGGKAYVKTNLCTKLFHMIDHVVAFDENGLPVPLNSETNIRGKPSKEYLEDLEVPCKSKVAAVITVPPVWYSRNTNELMGPYKVFADTLKEMNYNVVIINSSEWHETREQDKKHFLQSKLKNLDTFRTV